MSLSPDSATTPIAATHDLHCHILPDWDDGPATLALSLEMAERAAAAGLRVVCATPHVGRHFGGRDHSSSEIIPAVERLQAELDQRSIPIVVVSGAELLLGAVDVESAGEVKKTWTYNRAGRYALVESPIATWPTFGNGLLHAFELRGATPIIAHPERYLDVQRDITILRPAVAQGALLQVTAGALLGSMGKPAQAASWKLLEAGMVHIIASDGHGPSDPLPHEVVDLVVERVGGARARQIFVDNPAAILAGTVLPVQEEVETAPRKASLFSRLLGSGR